jgi:hypothetical protein
MTARLGKPGSDLASKIRVEMRDNKALHATGSAGA